MVMMIIVIKCPKPSALIGRFPVFSFITLVSGEGETV